MDHFDITPPMSTYLLILIVSQLEYANATGHGDLPIRGRCCPVILVKVFPIIKVYYEKKKYILGKRKILSKNDNKKILHFETFRNIQPIEDNHLQAMDNNKKKHVKLKHMKMLSSSHPVMIIVQLFVP